MSQSDPCFVVRIAIALAALKHKPRHQSTASYLLDLQSHFPVATKDNDSREWRTYALELEKQLATLKAQRDADQELLSKLPSDASQIASTSDAPPPKKKSKKNPTKDQHDPEWTWDRSRADWSRFLSSQYPSSPSLVAAYTSLKGALAAPNTDLLSYASRLSDAILRVLDTIHLFLFSPPNPSSDAQAQTAIGTPSQLKPEHIDSTRIALASPLLMCVLRTALHTLVRTAQDITKSKRPRQLTRTTIPTSTDAHAYVDKVLDHLLEYVLLSLLRAITPLCSARLARLVSAPLKKDNKMRRAVVGKGRDKDKDKRATAASASSDLPEKTDVRTDVFALIGTSLEALDALPPLARPTGDGGIAAGVRDRLGLEAIRELEALYAAVPSPPPLLPSPTAPPSSLQPSSSEQPPTTTTPSEPQLPTPLSAPSSSSQPRPRTTQPRALTESAARAQRLERLAGTRAERVRVLATRDAGWFLASTLSLCVVVPAPTRGPTSGGGGGGGLGGGGLLREALLDRIGRLVRSVPVGISVSDVLGQQVGNPSAGDALCESRATANHNATDANKLALDPVCQNMLLAICERAVSHLASS